MKRPNPRKASLASALILCFSKVCQATTIYVDGVNCGFADAIIAANSDAPSGGCPAGSGADVLELPPAGNLPTVPALVSSEVTINGHDCVIDGQTAGRVLTVDATGVLVLNDTVITNGVSPIPGYNYAGGLRVGGGEVHIHRSIFRANLGGAILLTGATATITDTLIEDNDTYPHTHDDGYLANRYGGALSIENSSVTVSGSTIRNNTNRTQYGGGGGVYIDAYARRSDVSIQNSTISGNSSNGIVGGIILYAPGTTGHGSELELINVTLVGNSSYAAPAGFRTDGNTTITISQSIVSGNEFLPGSSVANAIAGVGATVVVDDYNLFGLDGNAGVGGFVLGATDIVPTVSVLGDIVEAASTDNGGATPTHALPIGSPAIDAVPAAACALMTDQAGNDRPVDGDSNGVADCDIGAFETPDPSSIFGSGFESPPSRSE